MLRMEFGEYCITLNDVKRHTALADWEVDPENPWRASEAAVNAFADLLNNAPHWFARAVIEKITA